MKHKSKRDPRVKYPQGPVKLNMNLAPELKRAIDAARGRLTLTAWITEAIERRLSMVDADRGRE